MLLYHHYVNNVSTFHLGKFSMGKLGISILCRLSYFRFSMRLSTFGKQLANLALNLFLFLRT